MTIAGAGQLSAGQLSSLVQTGSAASSSAVSTSAVRSTPSDTIYLGQTRQFGIFSVHEFTDSNGGLATAFVKTEYGASVLFGDSGGVFKAGDVQLSTTVVNFQPGSVSGKSDIHGLTALSPSSQQVDPGTSDQVYTYAGKSEGLISLQKKGLESNTRTLTAEAVVCADKGTGGITLTLAAPDKSPESLGLSWNGPQGSDIKVTHETMSGKGDSFNTAEVVPTSAPPPPAHPPTAHPPTVHPRNLMDDIEKGAVVGAGIAGTIGLVGGTVVPGIGTFGVGGAFGVVGAVGGAVGGVISFFA